LNRSRAFDAPKPDAKEARLHYRTLAKTDRYALLEVQLFTGRHHQIRCQLSHIGLPIKGDLKYGAPRSNPDGGISLHARRVTFEHPVSHQQIDIVADVPSEPLWRDLAAMAESVEKSAE
jgi:23S rRNA pseudouridine1911/1915/1917 synthase